MSWLSSLGRGRVSRRLEEGLSRPFSGCGEKTSFPSTSAGDIRELPRVPLRGEGTVELAGPLGTRLRIAQWMRASSRGKAKTSVFLSVSDSDRIVPAELGQESQASSFLRKGNPLASRGVQGVSGRSSSFVWNFGYFRAMLGGVSAPSCCAFPHRVASKRCQGIGFFSGADREIRVVWHVAPPTWLVSNFLVRLASS